MLNIINNSINSLNSSTFFAGIMMICLNIGSRYIQLNLDESTESYIKYALTKKSWFLPYHGWHRNIYMSLGLTAVFIVLADFIMNEKSRYCLLPKKFIRSRRMNELVDNKILSEKEINDALEVLEKAKVQKFKQNQLNYLESYDLNKF